MLLSLRRRALGALALLLATTGTLAVSPSPALAAPSDLLISEYVEGTSNNKAVEVENRTGAAVDLAGGVYALVLYFNGSTTPGQVIPLTGTLADGEVLVVAHSSAGSDIAAVTDVSTGSLTFNGDDAVVLRKGVDTVVDAIGQVGVDPGSEWGSGLASTADNTLRRAAAQDTADTVTGDAYDPSALYTGLATDTFVGLGLPGDEEAEPPAPEVVTIAELQGTGTGPTSRSPYAPPTGNGAGQEVTTSGVVTELSLARTSSGGSIWGFWLQTPDGSADADPATSEGVFVFTGSSATVDGHTPAVGDALTVTARAGEYFFATQLSSVSDVVVDGTAAAVPSAVEADPPADAVEAGAYWEALEGMQVRIPAGAVTTAGRSVFPGTADSEIWVIRGDDPLAQRADPYARRVFRDAHPLDAQPGLFDDGNGQRILVGPQGVKAAAADSTALLPPVRTFSTLDAAAVGAVNYSFEKYRVELTAQPAFTAGADPALNGAPQAPDRATEWSVGNINVENLYDRRDDPTDGCDFTGNAGCTGVSPPFDYVPASDQVYADRLAGLSIQIRQALHAPDVVTVQEAEDQDICSVTEGALTCGGAEAGDGRPDTVQELALRIAADGGPTYAAASDRDGADDRGIHNAFLYRTDRVELPDASSDDAVLGSSPTVEYRGEALASNADVQNPKALNADLPGDVDTSTGVDGSNVYTRAAQVGRFLVFPEAVDQGQPVELWLVNNHFSSGPDGRIGQRTEQAAYAAALADAIDTASPGAGVMVAGDLNVFPRPDDPVPPPDGPSDQLAPLYEQGLLSLWDVLVEEVPAAAYSYAFEGQAQTLDQQFVVPGLLDVLVEQRVAHVNADWPAEHQPATGRGVSDHDPSVARFAFPVPPVPQLDDEGFVRQQFADFVGRPPSPAEVEVFTEGLEDGSRTRGRMVDDLRRVAYDPTRGPIIRLYAGAFDRLPDVPGTEHWAGRLEGGMSLRSIAARFVASPEFQGRYGDLDDGEYVDQLYRNVLDRPADPAGRAHWVGRLEAGTPRGDVLVSFTESAENRARTRPAVDVVEIYHGLLARTPTLQELAGAVGRVATAADRAALVEEITSTSEYAERVGA